jgi:Transposase IS116/IS110/IS902 family
MTTPGVGSVVALTYRATVDVPARFRKSKAVGAVFGLTCSKYQSGEIDRSGRISRCGDEMVRKGSNRGIFDNPHRDAFRNPSLCELNSSGIPIPARPLDWAGSSDAPYETIASALVAYRCI